MGHVGTLSQSLGFAQWWFMLVTAWLNDFRCFKDALVGPLEQDLFQEVSDCGNSEIGISVFNPKVLDASNFVLTPQSAHSQGHGMSLYGSEVPEVISQIR